MPKRKKKGFFKQQIVDSSEKCRDKQKALIDAKVSEIQQSKTSNPNIQANNPIFYMDNQKNIASNNSSAQQNNPGDSKQVTPKINEQSQKQASMTPSKKLITFKIPTQVKPTTPLLPNPNVITLVGRNSKAANQQKKILKFQMQIQAMQEQQRLAAKQTAMHSNNSVITGMQTFMEMPSAPVMEAPAPIPPPMQMPTPMQIPTPMQVPTPIQIPTPMQIPTSVQIPTPMQIPTPTQIPRPVRDNVETVFAMDQDDCSFTDITPEYTQKQTIVQQNEAPNTGIERYGFKYPAGIPKSFLRLQQNNSMPTQSDVWPNYQSNVTNETYATNVTNSLSIQTNNEEDIEQPYSPSEIYKDMEMSEVSNNDVSKSSEDDQSNQKRVSAFRRLGPQKQPTKPKLTISLTVNDNQEVREVVDETEEIEEITPVHLREDVILSTDETVTKYIKAWPWKRNVFVKKTVTARSSKTVMMLEKEQMEEIYERDTLFVQVTINGYPPSWKKEHVLDLLMENMRGYSFIPCFIEFNREQCKFLTLRCRSALLCLHKCGFIIRKDDVELTITLGQTDLTLNHIDFVPRLVLRKRLHLCISEETKLDLTAFTLKSDVSHFIYFPLNRLYNQTELVQLQTEIKWDNLTHLNLSHNRITSLDGFELEQVTPKLKHLDLSYNCLERITALISIRNLPLKSINLEGNPLCTDYTDPRQYIKVIRMIFPTVISIDDVPIQLKGDMPKFIRNYCPESAKDIVEKFLEIYFPLIDNVEHRGLLNEMYDEDAYMTITYHYKLGFSSIYRSNKSMFQSARNLEENILTMIRGSEAIVNNIVSWSQTEHDLNSFTVDVLYHSDFTTVLRVDGILQVGHTSIPDDQQLFSFSRTVVLHSNNGIEYKIQSEMLYWGIPTNDCAKAAFKSATPKLDLKIDSTTDESLQKELLKIFMELTSMDKYISERCLEFKKWNIKEALDHFLNLLQRSSLDALTKDS